MNYRHYSIEYIFVAHGDEETQVQSACLWLTCVEGLEWWKPFKSADMCSLDQWFSIEMKRSSGRGGGDQGVGGIQLWKPI